MAITATQLVSVLSHDEKMRLADDYKAKERQAQVAYATFLRAQNDTHGAPTFVEWLESSGGLMINHNEHTDVMRGHPDLDDRLWQAMYSPSGARTEQQQRAMQAAQMDMAQYGAQRALQLGIAADPQYTSSGTESDYRDVVDVVHDDFCDRLKAAARWFCRLWVRHWRWWHAAHAWPVGWYTKEV